MDGTVAMWDPAPLLYATPPDGTETAPMATSNRHKAAVKGLDFSLLAPNLLASASADGEVAVWDLGAAPAMSLSLSMQASSCPAVGACTLHARGPAGSAWQGMSWPRLPR